jgi:hypothetical protein
MYILHGQIPQTQVHLILITVQESIVLQVSMNSNTDNYFHIKGSSYQRNVQDLYHNKLYRLYVSICQHNEIDLLENNTIDENG